MGPREEMEAVIEKLESEYRFWMVETIKMGRSIELMEEEIAAHGEELGADRATDLHHRLSLVRQKHDQIEERILTLRQRLDELRERLRTIRHQN